MHPDAYAGFGKALRDARVDPSARLTVLDLGGQDVNGTVHGWFTHPETVVTTLDLENADIIADATTWKPDRLFDVVIATEVFEHVKDWRAVIATAKAALHPWGVFVATCASTDRPAHGATGLPTLAPGEWYQNVDPADLREALGIFARSDVVYQFPPGDAYMWGKGVES